MLSRGGGAGQEEELQQGVLGKRPASPAPHPTLLGRCGGSSAQFGWQPEGAGLLAVMVAELWCWVPLVQCLARNWYFPTLFFSSFPRATEPAGHSAAPCPTGENGMLGKAGW